MTAGHLAMLARTAVHLQPSQLVHRARLRGQRTALLRWPQSAQRVLAGPDPTTAVGWPDGFAPVDAQTMARWPSARSLESGHMELLGATRHLGDPQDWWQLGAAQLWRFHLHYWDWAWGLTSEPDGSKAQGTFERLWLSWREVMPLGAGDAWLPYPTALRAWSWCGQYRDLVAGGPIERGFVGSLATHLGFLRRHLERDVGGNHLVKDLKALVGLAVFFDDGRLLARSLDHLAAQVRVQVLPDGGHYERAPAYHCQVLADLVDVSDLVRAAGVSCPSELADAVCQMRDWLSKVLLPGGNVPLLNDGFPVDSSLVAALRPGPGPASPLVVLPDTGLFRATAGGWHLLADIGTPCPRALPAHAHADTLGCVIYIDGIPLLVDTGTSTYAAGAIRDYERSTGAHNTVGIDDANSTEVWGAFRAGRRAGVSGVMARATSSEITVGASHDGFRWLSGAPVHRRRWSLTDRGLRVDDQVTGTGRHEVVVRWHLAPGSEVSNVPAHGWHEAGAVVVPEVTVVVGNSCQDSRASVRVSLSSTSPMALEVACAPVATGFERTVLAPVLTCRIDAKLPVLTTALWGRGGRRVVDGPGGER